MLRFLTKLKSCIGLDQRNVSVFVIYLNLNRKCTCSARLAALAVCFGVGDGPRFVDSCDSRPTEGSAEAEEGAGKCAPCHSSTGLSDYLFFPFSNHGVSYPPNLVFSGPHTIYTSWAPLLGARPPFFLCITL